MGVEPVQVQSESVHVSAEVGIEEKTSILKDNGELNNGVIKEVAITEESINDGGVKNLGEANLPKDAVDEWPEPKKNHLFFFVKYRRYEDQQLKTKADFADKDLQKLNDDRSQIVVKLREKKKERANLISDLKGLGGETKQFRIRMDDKRKEMEPLTQALGKLRNKNGSGPDRGVGICSSVEELNDLIKSYEYRMTHESIPLTEEKKLMREIKILEGTREKVIANAQMRAKIQDSLGQKEDIQDKVKNLGVGLDGVRKEQQVVKAKLKELDDQKVAVEKQISTLQEELTLVTEKRDKAYEKVIELRKQRDQGNSCVSQYNGTMRKVTELVKNKDVVALKELAETEVETFMSKWSSTKAFRDDYEKRLLTSLDRRQFSRDGRMRNPEEKPLVQPVAPPVRSEPEVVAKPKPKEPVKEEASKPQQNVPSSQKVVKEKSNNKPQKEEESSKVSKDEEKEDEEISVVVKEEKVVPKVDEAKLKEAKREEEIAKAKQALERKKKLAEKAAAKASIKAQKEAEKKQRNIEKKAKKKSAAASGTDVDEQTESAAEEVLSTEAVNADEKVETTPVPVRQRKDNSVKYRGGRARGQDSLPKIILKRKKSNNQWLLYGIPAASLLIVLLVAAYYYLL